MFSVITDPGVDDLIALTLLSKLSKNNNSIISTFGNVSLKFTDKNTKEFILLVAPEWSYFKGAELPLLGKIQTPWADSYHGHDGTWSVHPQRSNHKVKLQTGYPENKNVISLAPLTDLTKIHSQINLESVTIMGGSFDVTGNETQCSEFNIAADPESANNFFQSDKNLNIKVVPLDITHKVNWTQSQVNNIPETSKVNIWLKRLLLAWFKHHQPQSKEVFELYDPLAVYLAFFPDKAKWSNGNVSVILNGSERGKTVFKRNSNSTCKVALDLNDASRIEQEIFKIIFE